MNRIGWCDMTFNPVWGCNNRGECKKYCYAKVMAKRFGAIRFIEEWHYRAEHNMDAVHFKLKNSLDLIDFKPTFLYSQIGKKLPKKPQRIFVGSMSEIYYWEKFWVEGVIKKIKLYPQHIFQFLTRYPEVYSYYIFPKNCWLGVTVTCNEDLKVSFPLLDTIKFISIEPILEKINSQLFDDLNLNWVIIGAETGNRKGKIIPEMGWICDIIYYCKVNKISIYLKDSLKDIYPDKIKEFPKGVKRDESI